jgi:hypothetical protein
MSRQPTEREQAEYLQKVQSEVQNQMMQEMVRNFINATVTYINSITNRWEKLLKCVSKNAPVNLGII